MAVDSELWEVSFTCDAERGLLVWVLGSKRDPKPILGRVGINDRPKAMFQVPVHGKSQAVALEADRSWISPQAGL